MHVLSLATLQSKLFYISPFNPIYFKAIVTFQIKILYKKNTKSVYKILYGRLLHVIGVQINYDFHYDP